MRNRKQITVRTSPQLAASQADPDFKIYAAQNTAGQAELRIYDQIGENIWGEGISAASVVDFLETNKDRDVLVRINSFGGYAYDGLTIHNALLAHPHTITTQIDGIAFSAAGFIAMAGDVIRMAPASDLGIHRAQGVAAGNKNTLLELAAWLEILDEHQLDIFEDRTAQTRDELTQILNGIANDGTVIPAKKAVEMGLADELIGTPAENEAAATKTPLRSMLAAKNAAARRRFDRLTGKR